MISSQECLTFCSIKKLIEKECIFMYKNKSEDFEIKAYYIMIKNIEHDLTSEDYNVSRLEKGEEDIIGFKKMIVTLIAVQNQKK